MTPDQLEQAARKLCAIRGLNPDQMLEHGAPPDERGYVLLHSPQWKLIAAEIRAFYQVAEAIDSVLLKGLQ